MISGKEIKELRKRAGFASQGSLAKVLGVSRSAVYDWERGKYFPEGKNLVSLASALNVSVEYLLGDDSSHKYNVPDFSHNAILDATSVNPGDPKNMQRLKDMMNWPMKDRLLLMQKIRLLEDTMVPLPIVSLSACAGNGNGYAHIEWKIKGEQFVERNALMGHSWRCSDMKLIDIEGDSMEPRFSNGDRVLFVEGENVVSGDIAIVWWDSRLYIRGVTFDKGNITLRPLNKKYPEITVEKDDSRLYIVGKVIAEVPPLRMVNGIW